MTRGTALVIGGRLPALTAARALAVAGYQVLAGNGGEYSTVRFSRHCRERWVHPPIGDGERFTSALVALLTSRPDVTVVVPVGERSTRLLAAGRDRLPEAITVAAPAWHLVKTCTDKAAMYGIAREVDVPTAATRAARDLPSLVAAADEVGYPCIVKPAAWAAPLPEARKAIVCPDRASLDRQLVDWPPGHTSLLVQRLITGRRHNLYFVARSGRILASIQTRTLRTDRVDGTGVGVEAVTVARDPMLIRHCEALLERLGYTGTGLAQFIVDRQGVASFLEIKPSLGSGYAFAEAMGLGQTVAAIDLASARAPDWLDRGFVYAVGRRYAWTSRDLYGLGMAISRGELGPRRASRWFARALRSAGRADVHGTWSWRDPLPTLALYTDLSMLLLRAGRARLSARSHPPVQPAAGGRRVRGGERTG